MVPLKTNRSKGLYIGFSVFMKFFPLLFFILLIRSAVSKIGSMVPQNFLFGSMGDYSYGDLGGFSYADPGASIRDMVGGALLWLILAALIEIGYLVYVIVLFWGVCKDMNAVCERQNILNNSPVYLLVWLLSGITLNIYYVFWSNQQGERLEEAGRIYGRQVKSRTTRLVFSILGSLPVWFHAFIFGASVFGNTPFLFKHPFISVILCMVGFIFGFFHIANMASFISDVNVLADAYNGMPAAPYDGQDQGQFAEELEVGDDDRTISVNEWARPEGSPVPSGRIACPAGVYAGAEFPVDGELMIGRDETSCHIVIKVPEVSRLHCGIRYNGNDGTYTVTDYSSNGVYYKNGQALPKNQPVICGAGTVLVIAKTGNEFLLK